VNTTTNLQPNLSFLLGQ